MATAGTQSVARPGIIELQFGEPDPALFPAVGLAMACAEALADGGTEALPYGANAGPPGLRRLLGERLTALEARDVSADETLISGGNSQALDQVLTLFCDPGDVVLVELPTYSLALGILRDHPVHVEAVACDADGLVVEALRAKLDEAAHSGRRVRAVYTVPTFHNPTGICLAGDRRRELVELAAERDLLVVEDDVYRELWYDEPSPPSLWSLASPGTVVRLGSFAKTLAPGLRVGWVNGTPEQIDRIAESGLNDSGGCVSQFAACAVGHFVADGRYDAQVERLRAAYRERRDVFVSALAEHLPPECSFTVPGGGFFVWVTLPGSAPGQEVLPLAEERGVSFVPAVRSHLDGSDRGMRLCFTLYDAPQLAEAARRLGEAVRVAIDRT
jgi:2-aminoadipate transaminase